jgi:hypothetical protein
LSLPSDIFALGLIYTQYLTGSFPKYDRDRYNYACEAVRAGERLRLVGSEPDVLQTLLLNMMSAKASDRPTIQRVFDQLKDSKLFESVGSAVDRAIKSGDELKEKSARSDAGPRIRGTLSEKITKPGIETPAGAKVDPKEELATRLRGKLASLIKR